MDPGEDRFQKQGKGAEATIALSPHATPTRDGAAIIIRRCYIIGTR
jgi:hypothetical protein